MCQKLIEINKKYIIPNFNYKTQENISSYSNEINTDSQISGFRSLYSLAKISEKNQLSKFYLKLLNYINSDEIQKDFEETNNERDSIFSFGVNFFKSNQILFPKFLDYLKDLTILSLYFHNYPYLLNLFSFQEVKEAFENPISHSLAQGDINILSKELSGRIMNNESILVDKEKLKKFQLAFIHITSLSKRLENQDITEFIYHYQIINIFRDIDFCLKYYLLELYPMINNKEYHSLEEFLFCLTNSEPRYLIYSQYLIQIYSPYTFEDNEQSIINDTLTIKDFIVLGDTNFYEKIKSIETKIKTNSFQYLNIEQISNYLDQKKKEKGSKIMPYSYFVIMRFKDFEKYFPDIYALYFKTGITFLIFLFMENGDSERFYKNQMYFTFSLILVYSNEDILNYLSQQLNFYNIMEMPGCEDIADIKIPKITYEQNTEDNYQDGCFELAETFDVNLVKNNFMFSLNDDVEYLSLFVKSIYNIYKEHNALD